MGDVAGLLDPKETLVGTYEYDPYGKLIKINHNSEYTDTDGILERNPFRYRGYYYDVETGWYYLQSRYYDPAVKRFINADTTDLLTNDCVNLMQYNLFAYCNDNPVGNSDDAGCLDNWMQLAIGALVITSLAVLTACTGGAFGVICGAALTGAVTGGLSGAAVGAIVGGITNGWSGAIDSACSGFMNGTITGAITSGLTAGISNACGLVNISGSAQKTGTFFHQGASNIEAGKMAMNPVKYSDVYLNRCLNTSGLSGRKIPDVIGMRRDGTGMLIEVVSKSQTAEQMERKCLDMIVNNTGSGHRVIDWVAKLSWFYKKIKR